jgi:hypothetical protein
MTETTTRLTAALADRYRLERELGSGGMATVYLAEDLKHHRHVAIKVLHPELSAVIGSERFLKEIELTANLQHPHILPLYDSGAAGTFLYYVMPFIDGETLRVRLERERQLPVAGAVRIAKEVADALEYAHRRNVVHRDVKPENILLQGGHALVADFGIALAVQQAGGARMTQTGMSLGTPQYMAPEQAMGDKAVDHRADIYALAAVTYEMLAGEPPFSGASSQVIVAKVLTEDPKPLVLQRRSIPEPVERAILTGLEKLPADRFDTAAEFAAALEAETPGRPSAAHAKPPERSRAFPAPLAAGLGLGALALAALAYWAGTRSGSDSGGPPIAFGRVTPVTWDPGLEVHPAISPDGRLVAYAAGPVATRLRVYVRPVAGGRSVPLVDDTTQVQSAPRLVAGRHAGALPLPQRCVQRAVVRRTGAVGDPRTRRGHHLGRLVAGRRQHRVRRGRLDLHPGRGQRAEARRGRPGAGALRLGARRARACLRLGQSPVRRRGAPVRQPEPQPGRPRQRGKRRGGYPLRSCFRQPEPGLARRPPAALRLEPPRPARSLHDRGRPRKPARARPGPAHHRPRSTYHLSPGGPQPRGLRGDPGDVERLVGAGAGAGTGLAVWRDPGHLRQPARRVVHRLGGRQVAGL